MEPFSSDENAIVSFINLPQSTPKKPHPNQSKQKRTFECDECGKSYVSEFYYRKHISGHSTKDNGDTAQVAPNLNVSVAPHLDVNDISFNQFAIPSSPPRPKKKATNPAKPKRKPHLICTYCLKGYVCSRSFKSHLRAHAIQDAASCFPDRTEILNNSTEISDKAMTLTANSPSVGASGKVFKELVGHIISVVPREDFAQFSHNVCSELVKGLIDRKCFLPSALTTNLMEQVETVLSDQESQKKLFEILKVSDSFSSSVVNQFMLLFCLKFATNILKFISATFRAKSQTSQLLRVNVVELDNEEKQVVYYIAGSIMRGYLKISKRSKKSITWQNVAAALTCNVLIDRPIADIDVDSEWTVDVDRGGLLYINADCQRFFVNLTKVVYASEKPDGSIDYNSVIMKVSNSDLSVQWDDIIRDSLTETVSVALMNDVILCFCRTCGRGFAKRRLNFIRNKPVISMPTRHLVASRKNR